MDIVELDAREGKAVKVKKKEEEEKVVIVPGVIPLGGALLSASQVCACLHVCVYFMYVCMC
jgi:hypothetical protein